MPSWLTKVLSYLPFNQGKPKVQLGVLVLILLFFTALGTRCAHAEESYARLGVGSTVVRGPSAIIDLAYIYPDAGPGDSVLEVGTTFLGQSNYEGSLQQNNFALRAAIVDGLGSVEVGLGMAYLQNTDTYNGSNLNYNLILGYAFKRWPVTVRLHHFSNGGTRSPNKGRDMLFIAWRF